MPKLALHPDDTEQAHMMLGFRALPRHDERRLLRSMARAVADVHGAGSAAARAEAAATSPHDLGRLVAAMVEATHRDLAAWRAHHPGG